MLFPSAASATFLASHALLSNNTSVESVTTAPLLEQDTASEVVSSTNLNTDCTPVLGPMDDIDVALLEMIFNGSVKGTNYAQWIVNYASQLTSQIDNVASQAMIDPDGYTTALDTIDVTGVLSLAYAAPMYSCFLSSLWDEASPDPSASVKEATLSQLRKTRLMVLFEKRNDNNGDYNLAELLVRETENLLTEMNTVICSQLADPYDYTSLFTRLNVDHLISMAFPGPAHISDLSTTMLTGLDFCSTLPVDRKA